MTGTFVKTVTSYSTGERQKVDESKEELKAQNEIIDIDLNVSERTLI